MGVLLLTLAGFALADWTFRRRRALPRRHLGALVALTLALLGGAAALLPRGLVLQKVLGSLVMPAGLLWLGLLAAVAVAWHRRHLGSAAGLALLWVGYGAAGSQYVSDRAFAWLQQDYASIDPMELPPFDAVLVLGGGTAAPAGRPRLSQTGDRVALAAQMHLAGLAPVLVASGRSIGGLDPDRDLAEESRQIWESLGVPRDAIVMVSRPRNTSEEVRAYRALLSEREWDRVGLITSAWHLRRAMARCAAEGLDVHPLPSDIRGGRGYRGLISVVPRGPAFEGVHVASWEIVGALVGR